MAAPKASPSWIALYTDALRRHLHASGGEAALLEGYHLGRLALTENRGVVELILLHRQALAALAAEGPDSPLATRIDQAEAFLAETISPYEMVLRGYREANAALRHLHEFVELEAKRMAASLHDGAAQLLAAVHMQLDLLAEELPAEARERISASQRLLEEIESQLRDLAHELRPTILDTLGLEAALAALVEGFSQRDSLEIQLDAEPGPRMPAAVETAIYRAVHEALTNVRRHAQARHVHVDLSRLIHSVYCRINDDGIGMDTAARPGGRRGLGLANLRERVQALGGFFDNESEPGKGTSLHILIPVRHDPEDGNADPSPAG